MTHREVISASFTTKTSSDHFVRVFYDRFGMPTIVTNCSNNYGPYQFPDKLIPLFINNICHRKPLPVYGKGENVRGWIYVEDHARATDVIFHKGTIADTYNIVGFNEWKSIDIIKVVIKTVDRLLGRKDGEDLDLITYVNDRLGMTSVMPSILVSSRRNLVGSLVFSLKKELRKL